MSPELNCLKLVERQGERVETGGLKVDFGLFGIFCSIKYV